MSHFYTRISLITGLALGVLLAVYVKHSVINESKSIHKNPSPKTDLYRKWFKTLGLTRKFIPWDKVRYGNTTYYSEAEYLFDNIKVLCIILVKKSTNFIAANETWAKGCNSISPVFLEPRKNIMSTKLFKEKSSWVILCNMLNSIDYKRFDWVIIVRDTSYVISENFRYYVAPLKATETYYLGHAVKFWNTIYNSGDPGYALSVGSIKKFQKHMGHGECMKNNYWNKEDFYLGMYLQQLNITPVSTLDEEGLSTFNPYNWFHVFYPSDSYYKNSVYPVNCCSRRSIAFQAVEGDRMYTFNYLFYTLQIFTSGHIGNKPFEDSVPEDKTWKEFLRRQNIHDDNISSEAYYKLWENLINDPSSFAASLRKEELFDYN